MKRISLVIFNEKYWDKGLIYNQNIKPLLTIKKKHPDINIRLISFTPIIMLLYKYKIIKSAESNLKSEGVKTINLPLFFFPVRCMAMRWYLIPILYINVFPYLLIFNVIDMILGKREIYNLRSYIPALIFSTLYFKKDSLFFDTRTDFIVEQLNIERWSKSSLSHNFWIRAEKYIINHTAKTFFISDVQKNDTLNRHSIENDENKFLIFYNPIDVKLIDSCVDQERVCDFVYSGSLGNWNNLDQYLTFFLQIKPYFTNAKFYILTGTNHKLFKHTVDSDKYDPIRNDIIIIFNAAPQEIFKIYKKVTYGLQIMSKTDSRVGVKVVEYIASGVIPIVSDNVLGACALITKYDVGLIYNGEVDDSFVEKMKLKVHDSELQRKQENVKKIINIDNYSQRLFDSYNFVNCQ